MNKKLFWAPLSRIFLLATLSLISACSDAEENVSKNKAEVTPVIQKQSATLEPAKETEIAIDVTGLYKELATTQPTSTGDKIEVLEVFWYGCPHCYHFEPFVRKWLDEKAEYIEFVRLEKIHEPLFDAINKDKRKILDEKSLRAFFSEHGVRGKDFDQAYRSKEVEDKVRAAFTAGQGYELTGVPTIVINGKYTTSASMAGSFEKIISVINTLAAKEYKKLND
jgi:thiol:disulfide interchange protein DsbA